MVGWCSVFCNGKLIRAPFPHPIFPPSPLVPEVGKLNALFYPDPNADVGVELVQVLEVASPFHGNIGVVVMLVRFRLVEIRMKGEY